MKLAAPRRNYTSTPMLDLGSFLALVDELERKRIVGTAAVSSSGLASGAGRKRKRTLADARDNGPPAVGGYPWTGPFAPPANLLEDERRRRAGGGSRKEASVDGRRFGRGSGGDTLVDRSGLSLPPVGVVSERLAIAFDTQPAVVKLVSFAAGRARVGKLLTYQSRDGELPVENEAGDISKGRNWIVQLADEWSKANGREPSKDVLRLTIAVNASRFASDEIVGQALKTALAGHRIAWRIAGTDAGEMGEIELVVSAARRRQPGEEKAGRIYDNRKSKHALNDRLAAMFGPDTAVDVHGFAHGVEGVARYLGQLREGGSHRVIANRMDRSGQSAADHVLEDERSVLDEAKDWRRDLRSQKRRDVAHIVLSARPGTPKDAFVDAARAMLAREFAGRRYLFTTHEDRRHIHVHAVVEMQSEAGERLHPKIEDLRRWRRTIAEEARERDIPMDAVSRFERANPPGYKMKDIRRVERGEASESTRRRVKAVRDSTIHIPTREEGKCRAQAVAIGWNDEARRVATKQYRPEPPQSLGLVRLYRADREGARSSAPLFTLDRHVAAQRVGRNSGALHYLDVSVEAMQTLMPSRQDPENVFVVPLDLAAGSEEIDVWDLSLVQHFHDRAEKAIAKSRAAASDHNSTTIKPSANMEPDMPDLNVMNNAFTEMETNLDQIGQNLSPERLQDFDGFRKKLKVSQTNMLETQTEIEKKRVGIEGETYVTPVPHQFAGFVAEKRGEDVRYNHRKGDGRVGAVAFTDHGDRVEIGNWRHRESVLSAMQLGAEKWGALTVNGIGRYKALAVELAAEHGFQITNPELQVQLKASQALVEERRAREEGLEHQKLGFVDDSRTAKETEPTQAASISVGFPKHPIDTGNTIKPANRDRESMLVAMRAASEKWGAITVKGTHREKAVAVELAAEHGILISNPELQNQMNAAQAKVEDRRASERKQLGLKAGTHKAAIMQRTDAEIAIELDTIKESTRTEAKRENRQAERSERMRERPFDGGGEDHAYRTKAESAAARRAERLVEQDPATPIPTDINQSAEIERQRMLQDEILSEKEANKQAKTTKQPQ